MSESGMSLSEACEVAADINNNHLWIILAIERASGEKLEDNLWAVYAVCRRDWKYIYYWTTSNKAYQDFNNTNELGAKQTRRL